MNAIEAWVWLDEVGATVQFKFEKDGVLGVRVVTGKAEVWRPTLLEAVIAAQEYEPGKLRACSHCGHTK